MFIILDALQSWRPETILTTAFDLEELGKTRLSGDAQLFQGDKKLWYTIINRISPLYLRPNLACKLQR